MKNSDDVQAFPSKYASLQWSSVSLFRIAMAHADLPRSSTCGRESAECGPIEEAAHTRRVYRMYNFHSIVAVESYR
jgi:hypothetical protein